MVIYILIAIFALAIVFALSLKKRVGENNRPSPLTSISLFMVIFGIIFGENRIIGYSFIGIGLLLALIDIKNKISK